MKLSTSGYEVDEGRMWRTLIHFMVRSDDLWYVSVSGWSRYLLIGIKHEDLPDDIQKVVVADYRCCAKVNTGEEDPLKLIFEDWELGMQCSNCLGVVFHGSEGGMYLVCDNCGSVQ